MLHKLGRCTEALRLLDQLERSMATIEEPDQADRDLSEAASELRRKVEKQA